MINVGEEYEGTQSDCSDIPGGHDQMAISVDTAPLLRIRTRQDIQGSTPQRPQGQWK